MSTPKQRAAALRREIDQHNYKYYVEAAPEISDREFDRLLQELQELEAAHPDFVRLNEKRATRGEKTYENPRNLTAGSLKLLDPRLSAGRRLRVFTYGLGAADDVDVKTHSELLALLKKLGFPVSPHIEAFDD